MVRDPEGTIEQVSRAVADGEAIDWNGLITADDPESKALIEQLRVLESVARLHRDTLPEPDQPATLPPPPLSPGDYWGHLTLRGELGRGARGHVYRAWDPQLDREVALKLSVDRDPEKTSKDVIGEARLLAKVRHPHIATIYGAERRSGLVGLWMELIEGETLEAMLARAGRFNAREAALIGIEVCSALSAVHRAGLLHRDIKTQNVMRDRNGRLVLMDFGTSRDVEPTAGEFVHDEVGTPLYMAPELFVGGKATVQSDIYSVGVLLYRLVTGSVPVDAHSPGSLRAAHEARARKPLSDIRSDLPLAFVRVVERALAFDPAERYRSAGALEMALSGLLVPVEPQKHGRPVSRWSALVDVAASALITAAVLGAWWWTSRPEPPQQVRFTLAPVSPLDEVESLAVSPEGRRVAFVSAGRLHLRQLDEISSQEFEQTQGAHDPFWSPDGAWIAFFKGRGVWKVRASGGEPVQIAPARRPSSGSWAPDGSLLYTVEHGTQILTVPSGGGTPRIVRAQRQGVRTSLWWPVHVGDGSTFVYSAVDGRTGRRTLYLARMADGADATDTPLITNDSNPLVAGSRLFYIADGELKVQRLDAEAGRLLGEPARVAEGLRVNAYGFGNADVSVSVTDDGDRFGRRGPVATLAFVGAVPSPRAFTVVDGEGRTLTSFEALDSRDLRVSPDGTHLAYEQVDEETGTREIWVLDLQRQSRVRLTQHAAEDLMPVWSPDGRTLYFLSKRTGRNSVFAVAAQGGQREQELFTLPAGMVVLRSLTPDGRSLVYEHLDQQGGWDIWMRSLDGGAATPLVQSSFNDQDPAVSPDGRFLAYSSPESGGRQVWLIPLPADGRRWRISSDYGRAPLWSADGGTLYFHGLNKTLTRVPMNLRAASPVVGSVQGMFTIPFRGYDLRHHFDVLPGGRFIVNAPAAAESEQGTIIVNLPLP